MSNSEIDRQNMRNKKNQGFKYKELMKIKNVVPFITFDNILVMVNDD